MSDSSLIIRPATSPADIDHIRTLMREYGEHLANLDAGPTGAASICLVGYEAELAALPAPYIAPGALLLALLDRQPVGCVALKPVMPTGASAEFHAQADGGPALELKRLWVRPSGRGLRLGRKLMEAAVAHARTVRATALYLDTVPAAMPEANRLYAALGFEPVDRYNDNPVENVAFFRLRLETPNQQTQR